MLVERVPHNGTLVISETVTDGSETWLETQRYIDYTEPEARALFAEHLRAKGYSADES